MRAIVIAAALAGCGRIDFGALHDAASASPYDPNDGSHSGTRLKLMWWQFDDGARQLEGLWDSQRGESCLSVPWNDGALYCSPTSDSGVDYTDSLCTQPAEVYPYFPPAPQPAYFVDSTSCGQRATHLYERGTAIPAVSFYEQQNGTCTGPFGLWTSYTLGAEVLASELVQLNEGAPATGDRIGLRTYTTSDGLSLQATLHDMQLGTDCTATAFNGGESCAPARLVGTSVFDNSQCTDPLEYVVPSCGLPAYMSFRDHTSCTDHVATLGAQATAPAVYQLFDQTCMDLGMQPSNTYYNAGPDVSLAPLTRVVETAPGHRLQRVHFVTGGVTFRDDGELHDTLLGTDCFAVTTTDGLTRCAPSGPLVAAVGASFYADAMCTTGLDLAQVSLDGCTTPDTPLFATAAQTVNSVLVVTVYPIEAQYTGPRFEMSGTCIPAPVTPVLYYQYGAALDPTTFALATQVIDP